MSKKEQGTIAKMLISCGDPRTIAETMSKEVNQLGFKADTVLKYIWQEVAEAEMAAFAAAWIRETADDFRRGNYDDRNEYSSKMACALMEHSIDKLLESEFPSDERVKKAVAEAAAYLKREHRTIKQSISGLCFAFVKSVADECDGGFEIIGAAIQKMLKEMYPDDGRYLHGKQADWERCPFI